MIFCLKRRCDDTEVAIGITEAILEAKKAKHIQLLRPKVHLSMLMQSTSGGLNLLRNLNGKVFCKYVD